MISSDQEILKEQILTERMKQDAIKTCSSRGEEVTESLLRMICRFHEMEKDIDGIGNELKELERKNETVKSEIESVKKDVNSLRIDLKTRIGLVEGKLDNINENLSKEIKSNNSKIDKLIHSIASIKSDIRMPIVITNMLLSLFIFLSVIGAVYIVNTVGNLEQEKLEKTIINKIK